MAGLVAFVQHVADLDRVTSWQFGTALPTLRPFLKPGHPCRPMEAEMKVLHPC